MHFMLLKDGIPLLCTLSAKEILDGQSNTANSFSEQFLKPLLSVPRNRAYPKLVTCGAACCSGSNDGRAADGCGGKPGQSPLNLTKVTGPFPHLCYSTVCTSAMPLPQNIWLPRPPVREPYNRPAAERQDEDTTRTGAAASRTYTHAVITAKSTQCTAMTFHMWPSPSRKTGRVSSNKMNDYKKFQ
ncbi:hypothetical protein J6590_062932 [Homalodisca vitripennis]|nr:hypothetical protein J6590_062932 [Homalodisca vitripennis]